MTRYDWLALAFAAFLLAFAVPGALRNAREAREDAATARAVYGLERH